jgi:NADH-quinone oxidoreductase subunit G
MLADALNIPISLPTVKSAAKEFASLGVWDGAGTAFDAVNPAALPKLSGSEAILTSWRRLLDEGSLQEGEENLAGTARKTVAVISPKRAQAIGVIDGDTVCISNTHGSVVLPVLVEEIHDDAVWLPRNSRGSHLLATLGVASGAVVTVVKE